MFTGGSHTLGVNYPVTNAGERQAEEIAHKALKYGIINAMEKCFNIAGPCFPDEHYMLPALERLPGIMRIVEQRS